MKYWFASRHLPWPPPWLPHPLSWPPEKKKVPDCHKYNNFLEAMIRSTRYKHCWGWLNDVFKNLSPYGFKLLIRTRKRSNFLSTSVLFSCSSVCFQQWNCMSVKYGNSYRDSFLWYNIWSCTCPLLDDCQHLDATSRFMRCYSCRNSPHLFGCWQHI